MKQKKVKILCIDGGGIRGLIPATILSYIEQEIQKRTGNPEARLSDYFDMIAGTSTGGILACLYTAPASETELDKNRFFAREAIGLYKEYGKRIFKKKTCLGVIGKLLGATYTEKGLEEILKEKLGDIKLSQTRTHCLLTSYEISERRAMLISSRTAIQYPTKDYLLRHVARGTSAAPTYFPPSMAQSMGGKISYMIDGGMYANDPTLCSIVEARKNKYGDIENPNIEDMFILSVGTGKVTKRYDYLKARSWGLIGWILPVIDILMSASAEVASYQTARFFEATNCKDNYCRLDADLGLAKPEMDDVSENNILNLENAGLNYINLNIETLNKVIDRILEE